jgi:TonB family protein
MLGLTGNINFIKAKKAFLCSMALHILLILGVYASSLAFTSKYDFDVSSSIAISVVDNSLLKSNNSKSPKTHKNSQNDIVSPSSLSNNSKEESTVGFSALHPNVNYEDLLKSGTNSKPVYPLIAKINHWEGVVTLRIIIDEQGNVNNVELVQSSSHKVLDDAAINAVKKWKLQNHSGKKFAVVVPINFKIKK